MPPWISPDASSWQLVAFTMPGAERRFAERLRAADVSVSLSGDRIRISPSIFNDQRDIEELLDAHH